MDNYILYKGMWIYNNAPHTEQKLNGPEIRHIMTSGGWALRNAYNFDIQKPTNFWYVIKDSFDDMSELSSKTRNQVRRAFKNYNYKMIDRSYILQYGYDVFQKACDSYAVTAIPPTIDEFRQRIMSAPDQDEFWGAINKENGQLAAIAINHIADNSCNYSTLKANPEDMKNYVYYGLIYVMNEYYLKTKGFNYVYDGARSATNHSNIQPFLMDKFNFRKAYCNMHITYKWWAHLAIILLLPFYRIIPLRQIKNVIALHKMQD